MEETPPQLLFCGYCDVPGTTASGTRLHQMIASIPEEFLVDALAIRGPSTPHIERVGNARLMRARVSDDFRESLASYQRALQRQLASDSYQLVYCADIFSAQIAVALKEAKGFTLVVEVNDLPSSSFHRRYPVNARDKKLRKSWHTLEQNVLRGADRVVASSRRGAHLLAERVDPRSIEIIARGVDLTLFSPPTVEIALDDRKTIAVFGGRAGREIAGSLAEAVDGTRVRVTWIGVPSPTESAPPGVDLVAVDGPARIASALTDAAVVIVPTTVDEGTELWGAPHRALEAMACGRPVILMGDPVAFHDVIGENDALVLKPASGPEEIAIAALELLDDDERRERFSTSALRAVREHADLSRVHKAFAGLFTELVGVAMKLGAGEQTTPYEDTRLVVQPQITASLPPPPMIELRSADLVDLGIEETSSNFGGPAAFETRPTDIESHVAPSSSGAFQPVGAKSLAIAEPADDSEWAHEGLETEILARDNDDEVDSSDTQRNRPAPSVSSRTFATLQAIQVEIDEESGSPWGDTATADTIADAAPLDFESMSGKARRLAKKLLADDELPMVTVEESKPASD